MRARVASSPGSFHRPAAAQWRGLEACVVGRDPARRAQHVDRDDDQDDRHRHRDDGGDHARLARAASSASPRAVRAPARSPRAPRRGRGPTSRNAHGRPAVMLLARRRTASSPLSGSGSSALVAEKSSIRRRCSARGASGTIRTSKPSCRRSANTATSRCTSSGRISEVAEEDHRAARLALPHAVPRAPSFKPFGDPRSRAEAVPRVRREESPSWSIGRSAAAAGTRVRTSLAEAARRPHPRRRRARLARPCARACARSPRSRPRTRSRKGRAR